jgi:protein-S-isoprenylcysteine O-methyltransferase Ste14
MVALACYQPFWGLVSGSYISYEDDFSWGNMLNGHNLLYFFLGILILMLVTIYVLSTVVFGVRFSNLTNRGIITNGPYRFLKHPAYICKNLSWWLISLPFISNEGVGNAIKHSLLLLLLNTIYYFRAITEERHLSLDPVYVQYATALNDKGIFRKLYKVAPFLKYDVNKYIEKGKIKKLYF